MLKVSTNEKKGGSKVVAFVVYVVYGSAAVHIVGLNIAAFFPHIK
jgi:hypothetical protein